MAIKLGGLDVLAMYVGDKLVTKQYFGDALIEGAPGWLHAISPLAVMGWDFRTDQRYRMEQSAFTRATAKYALSALGVYTSVAADIMVRSDLGVSLEAARTNLIIRSTNASLSPPWNFTNLTASLVSGITQLLENTNANTDHRVVLNAMTVASGSVYTFHAEIRKRGRRYVYLRGSPDGTNPKNVGFDLDTGTVTYQGSGVSGRITALGDGRYRLEYSFTAGSTSFNPSIGASSAAVGSDTIPTVSGAGDVAQGFDLGPLAGQLELGASASSRIDTAGTTATRAADALTLSLLRPGNHAIKALLSDNTVQTLSASASGTFAVIAANLNRPLVKAIWAEAA